MNNKFDDLAKAMVQSVTRRAALKKFGIGLAGLALACFGLTNNAAANKAGCAGYGNHCSTDAECCSGFCDPITQTCDCTADADCRGSHQGKYCCYGHCTTNKGCGF